MAVGKLQKFFILDEPDETRFMLQQFLVKNGFQTVVGSSFYDAGEQIGRGEVDILLCNYKFLHKEKVSQLITIRKFFENEGPLFFLQSSLGKYGYNIMFFTNRGIEPNKIEENKRNYILFDFRFFDFLDLENVQRILVKETGFERIHEQVAPPVGKKTILVTDDVAYSRMFLEQFLSKEGYVVMLAKDGLQAIDLVAAGGIDLLLLDLKMPGIDGVETLRRIREFDKTLIVLIISAWQDINQILELNKMGISGYVNKPIDFNDLKVRIKNALLNSPMKNQ